MKYTQMRNCLFLLVIFSNLQFIYSQVSGTVTDENSKMLPYVNIYTEDGSFGTTTNEEGYYQLKIEQPGNYNLVFQFLGYKTLKKQVSLDELPFQLNVSLRLETTSLDEVTINSNQNPANAIIRNAIAKRAENAKKIDAYTADFYSRGLWRIKNAPEKILGQEIGDLGGGLDSTRSGVVYLSETISEIAYQNPDDFKEKIIASKVSGNDNGFSLNSAQEAYFSFYENTLEINSELVSPIADYAFNYYTYKLEGSFYDDNGNLINKIQVSPKRPKDRVFSGAIYIVEDVWQIYGVELNTTGQAIQVPPVEDLLFKQNYKYSEENNFYIQISQSVDFSFKIFGFGGDGRFIAVYSNYNFNPNFSKKSFGNEILSFATEANKNDSLFWQEIRPIPLTGEEIRDYVKKDSIQEKRNSKVYKDSVDAVTNKLNPSDLLFGYTYSNSYEKNYLSVSGPVRGTHFNTVQGWNTNLQINYRQNKGENNQEFWRLYSDVSYGFSDERFRWSAGFQKKFNNFNKPYLTIEGGAAAKQINNTIPISNLFNDIATIFFERNYLKLYNLEYAMTSYSQEVTNGLRIFGRLAWENRKPLRNHEDHVFIDNEDQVYTSNNPLQPENFESIPFPEHSIFKLDLSATISFGQKFLSYPTGKFNVDNEDYPVISIGYEKGFGGEEKQYDFDQFKASAKQDVKLGNKGVFSYQLSGGLFTNAEGISLVDYKHFNGNQTRIGTGSYLGKFNLMPYYQFSTNKNYAEFHAEQDFKGWILGKLPLINKLNYNLILGAHRLSTQARTPYSEYSIGIDNIGFGKYRFLRLDYVISNFNGIRDAAIIFGIKIL